MYACVYASLFLSVHVPVVRVFSFFAVNLFLMCVGVCLYFINHCTLNRLSFGMFSQLLFMSCSGHIYLPVTRVISSHKHAKLLLQICFSSSNILFAIVTPRWISTYIHVYLYTGVCIYVFLPQYLYFPTFLPSNTPSM